MTCSRSTFLRVALPGAALGLALKPAFSLAATDASDPTPFSGVYKYAGGRAQREKLDQQIEQVVAQLNFMIRSMARSRLQDGLSPWPMLSFEFSGNHLVFRKPGDPVIRGPLDGSPVKWKNRQNEAIELRLGFRDDALHIRYKGDGSDSRYTYKFADDGSRLDVRARIDHVRMPSTLKYGLTYKRS